MAHGDKGWLAIGASSMFDPGAGNIVSTGNAQLSSDGTTWRSSPTTPKDLVVDTPVFSGGRWYATREAANRASSTSVDLLVERRRDHVDAGRQHPDPWRQGGRPVGAFDQRLRRGVLIAHVPSPGSERGGSEPGMEPRNSLLHPAGEGLEAQRHAEDGDDGDGAGRPSRGRCHVPALDGERAQALEDVGDRVPRRHVLRATASAASRGT